MKLSKILKEIQIVPPAAPNKKLKKMVKITREGSHEPVTKPIVKPDVKPDQRPIRRPIGDPDIGAKPKPKAEGYGWDVKKGLTQVPKPPITKDNKPKDNYPRYTNSEAEQARKNAVHPSQLVKAGGLKGRPIKKEGIVDKITQRFNKLK